MGIGVTMVVTREERINRTNWSRKSHPLGGDPVLPSENVPYRSKRLRGGVVEGIVSEIFIGEFLGAR